MGKEGVFAKVNLCLKRGGPSLFSTRQATAESQDNNEVPSNILQYGNLK